MKIVADENIHRLILQRLVDDGHDVVHIGDLAPSITDDDVLRLAVEREALLLTNDLDFGELVFVGAARHSGVLLLRLGGMPYDEQAELVAATVVHNADELQRAFSVLTEGRLRIRS